MINIIATGDDNKYAKIAIEGLDPLLSKTISTALERTIISCTKACAPVYFTFNSFTNYFKTEFLLEEFIQIRSNIENIKLISSLDRFNLHYSGSLKGELKVKDLKVSSFTLNDKGNDIKFLNPEDVILTVGIPEGHNIDLNINISKNKYFATTEENETRLGLDLDSFENTFIPCNSMYNPIKKVKTQIFEKDGEDTLVVEITTDGRVTAVEALKSAWNNLLVTFKHYTSSLDKLDDNAYYSSEFIDTNEGSETLIRTLEDLPLNTNEYNFVKLNYRYLEEFLKDFGSDNMKEMFKSNNVPFDEEELKTRLESLGIKVSKRKE